MSKRIIALAAALIAPYLIFSLVISLNEKDFLADQASDKRASFDVEKKQQIQKPKPKEKPKPKKRQQNQPLHDYR